MLRVHPETNRIWCPDCQEYLDCEAFTKDASSPDGYDTYCAEHKRKRRRESRRKYASKYNEKRRLTGDWRKYKAHGLDLAGFNELKEAQHGLCSCCGIEPDVLVTDHCHKTGEIRGLLCTSCNLGIGRLGDNIEGVLDALWYLSKQ